MGDKVSVLPNCVPAPAMRVQRDVARHKNVLFVGSLDYGPNQDAFRWLCTELKASIDRDCGSGVTLRIVGRRPFPGAAALAASSGVDLVADAPDLAEHYLWASLVVVPIRSGGGTRIKILEALSYGVPVVSTTLGAEGLSLDDGKDFLRADSADEFAAAVRRILTDPGFRERLAAAGLATHASRYSPDVAERIIAALHAA
jgi:glycosyltransferase involved in cell wall biosynthesis